MLIALWPRHWSRQQRSNATLVAALVLMVVMLALLGQILSLFPEPIGSNAQAFSDGARTTLWLTLISGTVGLILGTAAARALGVKAVFFALALTGQASMWMAVAADMGVSLLVVANGMRLRWWKGI